MHCIALHCTAPHRTALHCTVRTVPYVPYRTATYRTLPQRRTALYCIMRPYTEGQLDRYRIGIPRELSEIRTQPWLSEESNLRSISPQGTHLLIARRRNSITSVLVSTS